MIQTIEKEIGGSKYAVTQFTARRALRLQAKLIKVLGPFLFEISVNQSKAMELLSSSISEDTLETLVIEILMSTRKNGIELTSPTIDIEFAGEIGTLFEVVMFALEVNFENFWQALGIGKGEKSTISEPQTTKKTLFTRT